MIARLEGEFSGAGGNNGIENETTNGNKKLSFNKRFVLLQAKRLNIDDLKTLVKLNHSFIRKDCRAEWPVEPTQLDLLNELEQLLSEAEPHFLAEKLFDIKENNLSNEEAERLFEARIKLLIEMNRTICKLTLLPQK